eukprot:scaffold6503_cov99-Amphora_coffeaeformis.AAC.2
MCQATYNADNDKQQHREQHRAQHRARNPLEDEENRAATAYDDDSSSDSNSSDSDEDQKWRLTGEEKQAVRELQQAADDEGLFYQNLFELVKYVIVVRSIEPKVELRADAALERLRNRHQWMQKHQLLHDDMMKRSWREAHATVAQHTGQHFVQRYARDGGRRAVVATHMAADVPLDYIQASSENMRLYMVAAMYRMDMGAVDLVEARRGMALCTISDHQLTLGRAFKYVKFMKLTASDMKDMHPHTVKAVHAEVPSWVAHLLPVVKHVLPRKVAERVHAYSSLKKMDQTLQAFDDTSLSAEEWARRREARYQETVDKVSLD